MKVYHMKGFKHLFRIKNSTNKLRKAGYVLAHSLITIKDFLCGGMCVINSEKISRKIKLNVEKYFII